MLLKIIGVTWSTDQPPKSFESIEVAALGQLFAAIPQAL
jgi:hypothetical protein